MALVAVVCLHGYSLLECGIFIVVFTFSAWVSMHGTVPGNTLSWHSRAQLWATKDVTWRNLLQSLCGNYLDSDRWRGATLYFQDVCVTSGVLMYVYTGSITDCWFVTGRTERTPAIDTVLPAGLVCNNSDWQLCLPAQTDLHKSGMQLWKCSIALISLL